MSSQRPNALVLHDDGDTLDLLTRLFEAAGFDVVTAVAGFRAQAHLEGERRIDVVVAPWDAAHPVGGEIYQWALHRRYDLRDQFVFVASDVPPNFDAIVAGRCLAVPLTRPAEIVRIAAAAAKRRAMLEAAHAAVIDPGASMPRLLLVDDEPVLLAAMADFLTQAGFAVTRADSGPSAIGLLEQVDFDVLVVDWQLDGGSAEVYRWVASNRAHLEERLVFLSGGEGDDASSVAPGRPMFRKGADSHALINLLHEIARSVRAVAVA